MSTRVGLVAALLIVATACTPSGAVPLAPGDTLPTSVRPGAGTGTHLVWVLHPQDYLLCESHAREVRRAQRQRRGGLVPLTMVAVGGRGDWARDFIRRERLAATVIELSPSQFRSAFGRRAASALYVARGRRVGMSISVTGRAELEDGALSQMLDQIAEVDAGTGARATTITPNGEEG